MIHSRGRWWMLKVWLHPTSLKFVFWAVAAYSAAMAGLVSRQVGFLLAAAAMCEVLSRFFHAVRGVFNEWSQGSEVVYLWPYEAAAAHGPAGKRYGGPAPEEQGVWGELSTQLSTLSHRTNYGLAPTLDLIGMVPPPADGESELESDVKWVVAPYFRRPKDNETWMEAIREYLGQCEGVVVECSVVTPSLRQEIEQAVRYVPIHRILLVCEAKKKASAEKVRRLVRKLANRVPKSSQAQGARKRGSYPRIVIRQKSQGSNIKFYRDIRRWAKQEIALGRLRAWRNCARWWLRKLMAIPLHVTFVGRFLLLAAAFWAALSGGSLVGTSPSTQP